MMAENHVSLWRNLELAERSGTTEISGKANPCRRYGGRLSLCAQLRIARGMHKT